MYLLSSHRDAYYSFISSRSVFSCQFKKEKIYIWKPDLGEVEIWGILKFVSALVLQVMKYEYNVLIYPVPYI